MCLRYSSGVLLLVRFLQPRCWHSNQAQATGMLNLLRKKVVWFPDILWASAGWGCALPLFSSSFLCHGRHLSLLEHCLYHTCLEHGFPLGRMAQARVRTPLPKPRASVLQLSHMFWLPGLPPCSSTLSSWGWSGYQRPCHRPQSVTREAVCTVPSLPPPSFLLEKGVNQAHHVLPSPSSLADTSSLQKKVFLTNNYTFFHLYPPSFSSYLCS